MLKHIGSEHKQGLGNRLSKIHPKTHGSCELKEKLRLSSIISTCANQKRKKNKSYLLHDMLT